MNNNNRDNYLIKSDFLKLINPTSLQMSSSSKGVYSELEQLRALVNTLLHFKYMLVYVRKHFPVELEFKLKNIAPEFESDFEFCYDQCAQLVDQSTPTSSSSGNLLFFDSIRKQEEFYDVSSDSSYCSFKRQYLFISSSSNNSNNSENLVVDHQSAGLLQVSDNQIKPLPESMVDTIITEQADDQLQISGPEEFSNEASSQTGGGSNQQFSHPPTGLMINEGQRFTLNQQQQQQSQHSSAMINPNQNMMESESNKAFYANLLEMLPKSGQTQQKQSKDCCDVAHYHHQPSTSGQKRTRQSSPMSKSAPTNKYARIDDMQSKKQQQQFAIIEASLSNDDTSESMHVENDLLQVEYWCSFEGCRFKSKSLTQVKAHEERRHVKQIVKCAQDGCGSFFDTKDDLNEHMTDTHMGPLFRCALEICSKEFQSDYRLKQHIREEHKEEYLTCKVCTKKFKTRKYLTRHFRNVHPKEKITDEMATTLSNLDAKTNPMKCTIDNCDQKFGKRSKLKQHIKEEHKEEYLTCKFCDKVCKTRNNLTNHIWIMHEEGDFRCTFDECDFASKFRKNLLNHKKLRHQRVRQCPMNDCGEMIPITRYQRHMSSLHKIKNYACSWPDCGKSFADHNALKNHVRIHLNFKRYKCKWPECGYASEQRFTVITHIRVCHFKLPRTKKKQLELNISQDSLQNPYDYLEVCREDICI